MVVAVLERQGELDAAEERRLRREDETVDNEVWGLLPEEFTGWGEGQS